MKHLFFTVIITLISLYSQGQQIALLKYNGGGDWYANPTALPNLIKFCNQNIKTKIKAQNATISADNPELFDYPYLHMTGHGNVVFNENEVNNLRKYLNSGGFLHIDDNYGMDQYVRKEIKKIFPDKNLEEIPSKHQIFQKPYVFNNGIPKIHEHDNKKPQAFGIFMDNRLVLLYTYETDLGDGWEDADVHNDPAEVREKALKMGANIINYIFNN